MYIRRASSPSTVLWAFHTIQPSSTVVKFSYVFAVCLFVLLFFCLVVNKDVYITNRLFFITYFLYILNAVRYPYVHTYVRSSVTLGVASSVANDVIVRITS